MYKKILFAIDFDEIGVLAAKKAKKLADENSAELLLVHVIEPMPAYAYPGFAGFTEVEESIRKQAEKELDKLAGELGVDKKYRFLCHGSIKGEVLTVAKEQNVDLIVTGSHGKHGISLLLGSTANAILHGADCDMLIIRS